MDYSGFFSRHKLTKKYADFTEAEFEDLHLPKDVSGFLLHTGRSTFSDGFLWTVHPDDFPFNEIFVTWRLANANRAVFMRTALGTLIYYAPEGFYYFNPVSGVNVFMTNDFNLVINVYLAMDAFINDGFFGDVYTAQKDSLPPLAPDEVYSFDPPLENMQLAISHDLDKFKMMDKVKQLASVYNHNVVHM